MMRTDLQQTKDNIGPDERYVPRYIRKGRHYKLDEVFDHVKMVTTKRDLVDFDGDLIKMGSARYKLFKFKGPTCVKCGIVGQYFAKERNLGSKVVTYHFNLYALDAEGNEVLMTKDHIHPASKGGPNEHDNYDPMCCLCNTEKSDKI